MGKYYDFVAVVEDKAGVVQYVLTSFLQIRTVSGGEESYSHAEYARVDELAAKMGRGLGNPLAGGGLGNPLAGAVWRRVGSPSTVVRFVRDGDFYKLNTKAVPVGILTIMDQQDFEALRVMRKLAEA